MRDPLEGRGERASACESEDAQRVSVHGVLFEAVYAVLLNRIVQKCERVAIVEESGARAEDPRPAASRLPRDPQARREIPLRGTERRRQALDLIAQAGNHR